MTLVASALAGGDCIDDADVLRTGGTAGTIGCVVKAPSTLGTFLRSFRWGHVRQLDRVSRKLLSRAWAAGAGPGDGPLTIDLDSTMCETYGLAKQGARHHGYTGKRGYHPLLAMGTCYVTLTDDQREIIAEVLGIPQGLDLITVLPFGYRRDDFQGRGVPRKSVSELVYAERYGSPLAG